MVAFGEKVRIHYIGTFDDGTEFDNSYKHGEPLEFTVGAGHMIVGVDRAVSQMGVGEKRKVRVEPAEGYGEYREDFVEQVPCELMPNWEELPVGRPIAIKAQDGQVIQVTCLKVEDGVIYLDHNHFLAGKPTNFEIEVLEVVHESAIEQEKHAAGCACGCHEFKDAITRQNAEAAARNAGRDADGCGFAHEHAHSHAHEHGSGCSCGHDHA